MQTTNATKLYGGADLHGKNVFLSILDEDGRSVFRRRVKNDLDQVLQTLEPYKDRLVAIGVESTFNWYWLVDGLQEHGYRVELGNPAKMTQYNGIKITNDLTDADWLAEQLRLDIFPSCYIYPKEIRSIRDALRSRQYFVQRRTQAGLSLMGTLSRHGIDHPGIGKLEKWTVQDVKTLGLDCWVELRLEELLLALQESDAHVKRIEKQVGSFVHPTADYRRLATIVGIGRVLGMHILLESGDFSRFATAGDYASYCRTVKSERTSNEKKKGSNNRKNGNPYLAWALIEVATFAIRYEPRIHGWYERKSARSGKIKARKALAGKMAKAIWHVMHGKEFNLDLLFN